MNINNDNIINIDDNYMNVIQQQRDDIIHQFMLSLSSSCCHRVTIDNIRNIVKDIVNKYPEQQPQQQQRNIGESNIYEG